MLWFFMAILVVMVLITLVLLLQVVLSKYAGRKNLKPKDE